MYVWYVMQCVVVIQYGQGCCQWMDGGVGIVYEEISLVYWQYVVDVMDDVILGIFDLFLFYVQGLQGYQYDQCIVGSQQVEDVGGVV